MNNILQVAKYTDHLSQGHGTLNAIYAAVEKACEARGWNGVDLLIIGGDFQVRSAPVLSKVETNRTRQFAMPLT